MRKMLPVLLLMVLLAGCNKSTHVSGAQFQREYEIRNQQTMITSKYMGEKGGNVYLKRTHGDGLKEEIWFTETKNLDPSFLKELRQEQTEFEPEQT